MRKVCGKCGWKPEAKLDRSGKLKLVASVVNPETGKVIEEHYLCPPCYEKAITEGKAQWIEMLEKVPDEPPPKLRPQTYYRGRIDVCHDPSTGCFTIYDIKRRGPDGRTYAIVTLSDQEVMHDSSGVRAAKFRVYADAYLDALVGSGGDG